MAPYNFAIGICMTCLSRRFEYQADKFALDLGFANELGNALIKLNIDNLGFPIYDPIYSAMNHSHPTLLERLSKLNESEKKGN